LLEKLRSLKTVNMTTTNWAEDDLTSFKEAIAPCKLLGNDKAGLP